MDPPTTNRAARLEAGNKLLGTNILVSRESYDQLPDSLQTKAVDRGAQTVKGRAEQVHAYSF